MPRRVGKKNEYVAMLAEGLKATTGRFEPVYTHREGGRRLILKWESVLILRLTKRQARGNIRYLTGIKRVKLFLEYVKEANKIVLREWYMLVKISF